MRWSTRFYLFTGCYSVWEGGVNFFGLGGSSDVQGCILLMTLFKCYIMAASDLHMHTHACHARTHAYMHTHMHTCM